jgi:UDP-perosamine 4-acetyltransferase
MTPQRLPIVIIGAGGFSKCVAEILGESGSWDIVGLTDLDPTPRRVLGLPVLGTDDVLPRLRREGVAHAVVALGDNVLRQRLGQAASREGFILTNAASRSATIAPSASLGCGVTIMPGALIGTEATVSDLAIVNSGALLSHDSRLGEAAHIATRVAVSGNVRIGARTVVGVGASVAPDVTIGSDTIIGVGAAVVRDIPDGVIAFGIPARVHRARTFAPMPAMSDK